MSSCMNNVIQASRVSSDQSRQQVATIAASTKTYTSYPQGQVFIRPCSLHYTGSQVSGTNQRSHVRVCERGRPRSVRPSGAGRWQGEHRRRRGNKSSPITNVNRRTTKTTSPSSKYPKTSSSSMHWDNRPLKR